MYCTTNAWRLFWIYAVILYKTYLQKYSKGHRKPKDLAVENLSWIDMKKILESKTECTKKYRADLQFLDCFHSPER